MLIGRREFHTLDLSYDQLDDFFKKVESFISKKEVLEGCKIDIYKDQIACCGIFPLGIIVEIECHNEKTIKDLDLMVYSKIIEICERENIDYHESQPLKML
jgi:hypothetical protein